MKRTIAPQPLQQADELMRKLAIVQQVASTGSMSEAAWQLDLDVSAVSRQITAMERELGCTLFERHRRGVVPTESGEVYLDYARQVLLESQRMRERLNDLRGLKRGVVRIATVEAAINGILAPAIAAFHRRHGQIRFEIHRVASEVIVQSVQEGLAEIGIGFNLERSPGIDVVASRQDTLCAGVAPSHPLAARPGCTLQEVAAYPVAVPERHSGLRRVVEVAVAAERVNLNILLETNSLDCLRALCLAGEVVTLLSSLTLSASPAGGPSLVAVPVRRADGKSAVFGARLDFCQAERAPLSAAATAFLDFLLEGKQVKKGVSR